MDIKMLIEVLQASIAPCILISGIGLLLLSTTNRYARVLDRIRVVAGEIKKDIERGRPNLREHLLLHSKRCNYLRITIGLLSASVLFASVIMLLLFSTLVFNVELIFITKILFIFSLLSLVGALVYFQMDVWLSAKSIRMEVEGILGSNNDSVAIDSVRVL